LTGETIFKSLETYVATEKGHVLGFVQHGQPNFAWNEDGKYYDPQIGVIRHLYFDQGRSDAGEALLAQATDDLASFPQNHAFYHILGMSCNAHHGKLHSMQRHVDQLLRRSGFEIEHENRYYVLKMKPTAPANDFQLLRGRAGDGSNEERFELLQDAEVVGAAQVRYLDTLTGGYTRDTAYLTWIGVAEQRRGQGIGAQFLNHLTAHLCGKQLRYLHTDTASENIPAQRFYGRHGFQEQGYTRSYIQR
jgi:ribosomal protein S18 acetylase RimI-like enzyme